jgi:ABC-type dipeptide/oligopeptide/nickel transport system permease component
MLTRYILKRLLIGLVQLFGLVIAVFFLIRLLPADPVSRLVGMNASAEAYAQAQRQLGLDRPVLVQLASYLGLGDEPGLLQGSLGNSWVTGSPVASEIGYYLPVTLELITLGFIFAFAIAGLLFVYVFFYQLGWAPPPLGRMSPMTTPPDTITGFILIDSILAGSPAKFLEAAHHLMLPVLVLAFILSGPIIKMVRQNMVRALQSDFVLYANSIGLPRKTVARYALRAAMAPSMTLIGILYGFMLSGAVLVETVFSLGGIGQYAVRSVLAFDYPSIQGVVLVITAISLVVYLALDLIHAAIDPRIAY